MSTLPRTRDSEAGPSRPASALARKEAREPAICQVLHGLGVGGAEVLAAQLARRLRDRFRFVFACLDELGPLGESLRAEGFTVEVLGRRAGVDWECRRRLGAFVRRHRASVVHAHQYTPFFYAMAARLPNRSPSIIFTEHGRLFPDYPRRKRMVANRLFLGRRDRVVGVGESVRQALITNEGIPPARVRVIYNGIDIASFQREPQDRRDVRRELGLEADEFAILQVARLDALKDHGTAVRAIERVRAAHPRARLFLVGEGPELPAIRSLIDDRRLEPGVRLLGLRRDVGRLLSAADCVLLTSISEGIPLTLIEAMAAGLPVVSTDVGGVREVVVDGVTGLLAPSGGVVDLAAALLRLATDPALCAQMGRAGLAQAERAFSEQRMHGEYEALYEELLRVSRTSTA